MLMATGSQVYSQQLGLPTTSAGGTTATQTTFNLSYTLGEVGTGTFSQTNVILTGGFQQSDPSGIPLDAIRFDIHARWDGNEAIIYTAVSSDLRLVSWELERSTEGLDFEQTADIDAPPSGEHSWKDQPETTAQPWHYRLRVIDTEGQSWYSPIVVLHPIDYLQQAKLYPNPTSTAAFLAYHLEQEASLQLFDASGKQIRTVKLEPGDAVGRIDVEDLAEGSYYLLLSSAEFQQRFSLIVNK
jgi:hypothetical protein